MPTSVGGVRRLLAAARLAAQPTRNFVQRHRAPFLTLAILAYAVVLFGVDEKMNADHTPGREDRRALASHHPRDAAPHPPGHTTALRALHDGPACAAPPDFPNLRRSYTRRISTRSPAAQGHFDDGMAQLWGFNRAEALRAFDRALACDPRCAMCQFGRALACGPFANEPYVAADVWATGKAASAAMTGLAAALTGAERGLVESMARRYEARPAGAAHTAKEVTPDEYVQSMAALASQFPEDADVAVLHADAMLASQGYRVQRQYPTQRGSPADDYERAGEALRILGDVFDRHHPLALHLYIHMTEGLTAGRCGEGATCAGLCERAADALVVMAPEQGHLLHMPSHCYMRVGRYADAAAASLNAAKMNQRYAASNLTPYIPSHNADSMVAGAMLAGQQKLAMQGVGMLEDMLGDLPALADRVRLHFAQWEELLSREPAEGAAMEIFAHAMARAATGNGEGVAESESRLQSAIASSNATSTRPLHEVLSSVLRARKALLENSEADAVTHLRSAANAQLDWDYSEPPQFLSLWSCLGELLLRVQDKDVEKAKQAFETDLSLFPNNGYALLGLVEVAEAQGNDHGTARRSFLEAWREADGPLQNACPMMFTAAGDKMGAKTE